MPGLENDLVSSILEHLRAEQRAEREAATPPAFAALSLRAGRWSPAEAIAWAERRRFRRTEALAALLPELPAPALRGLLTHPDATQHEWFLARLLEQLAAHRDWAVLLEALPRLGLDRFFALLARLPDAVRTRALAARTASVLAPPLQREAIEALAHALTGAARAALIEQAQRLARTAKQRAWLASLALEDADTTRQAEALAQALQKAPYPRAIDLANLSGQLDRSRAPALWLQLWDAQRELLRLPARSQPYRSWRFQLFDAPAPPDRADALHQVLAALSPEEALLARVQHAPHASPAVQAQLWPSLLAMEGPVGWLGMARALPWLSAEEQAEARATLAEVAAGLSRARWSAAWERACHLWDEMRRPTRSSARLALAAGLRREALGPLLEEIARDLHEEERAARAELLWQLRGVLPAGAAHEAALLALARAARQDGWQLPAGPLLEACPPEDRPALLSLLLRPVETRAETWTEECLALWPLLSPEEQAAHWPQWLAAARACEPADAYLATLAPLSPADERPALLDEIFDRREQRAEPLQYQDFYLLHPEDAPAQHACLAAWAERAPASLYLPYLWECLAESAPDALRPPLLRRALDAYAARGLVQFDIGILPFEKIASLLTPALAWEALDLSEARAQDEAAETCRALLLPRLARLGADPNELCARWSRIQDNHAKRSTWEALWPALPVASRAPLWDEMCSRLLSSPAEERSSGAVHSLLRALEGLSSAAQQERLARLTAWVAHDASPVQSDAPAKVFPELLVLAGPGVVQRWLAFLPVGAGAVEARLALADRAQRSLPKEAAAWVEEARALALSLPGDAQEGAYEAVRQHADWLPLAWVEEVMRAALVSGEFSLSDWLDALPRLGPHAATAIYSCLLDEDADPTARIA